MTVLSAQAIYQSADFRLSRGGRPLPEPSTKRLVLAYADWSGFVTYTGIGRRGDKDTSDILRDWFRGIDDVSFDEVADLIRTNGTSWLRRIGVQRHTFVLAGYDRGMPKAAVISNFERWHGSETGSLLAELETSTIVSRGEPEILVTGVRGVIMRQERRALKRLVSDHGSEPMRIRTELMRLNRHAAGRSPELISPECVVYSQTADGTRAEVPSGSVSVQDMGLMRGEDLTEAIGPFLESTFGKGRWTVVQSTSARSGDREKPPPCEVAIVDDRTSGFELRLLAEAPGRRAVPRGGRAEVVVGEGAPEYGGPSRPCYWPSMDVWRPLVDLGGYGGQAMGVDGYGRIVGHSELPDRSMHAMTWTGQEVLDIHPPGGRSSGVRAVSGRGAIAGWLAVHPTEHGQHHYRPILWLPSGETVLFADLAGGWGEAVYVDDEALATGFVYHGNTSSAWIGNMDQLTLIGRPEAPCRSFVPSVITDQGAVTGVQINMDESRHIATWTATGGWTTDILPRTSVPEAFAADGTCGGRNKTDDVFLPWIRRGLAHRTLPYLRHHHHQVTEVGQSRLLGTATTDNCSHPLVWIGQT